MIRAEFISIVIGYIAQKAPMWIPEEGLEEDMLDILQERLSQHIKEIKQILGERSTEEVNKEIEEKL